MPARLAIFWDFAQLHTSLLTAANNGQPSRLPTSVPQPEVVDVQCLMAYFDDAGQVVYNRAYADWRPLGNYADVLSDTFIDLSQIFSNKQGNPYVFRQLSADLLAYLRTPDHAEEILIVGGGSEYRQLRQTVHEYGSRLIGLGVESEADDFWIQSCDDFHFYHRLGCRKLYTGAVDGGHSLSTERARNLLTVAINQLSRYYGSDWVQQVRIKPAIIRQEPDFDEGMLGYEAFSQFLRDQSDLLERRHREGEQEPEYRLIGEHAQRQPRPERADPEQIANFYLRVASQQGIRMPDPVIMWEGIDVYAGFLADDISFASFAEIDQECLRLLREDYPNLSMTEVKKVRQVLFKCFLFRPSVDDTIGFHDEIKGLEDIEDRYFQLMLARIGNNIQEPLDYTALSLALTGTPDQGDRLKALDELEEE
ncbi:hypothetical protein LEM8419_02716 [Neolewinella maritima]|uniref:NYN domain-containing protein n=1 Tax=Neolewinella maritima TaxID=1383882 RepID=A0ABM9B3K4_9BACT|nr:NYN domain-containing protein [Neolewinella maritima]CAH1001809.1 hypothetical protein LEM8419_02716 [Neolewinella maritima]